MKKSACLLLSFLLVSAFAFGQQEEDTNRLSFKPIIGFNAGLLFSRYTYDDQPTENNPYSMEITPDNRYRTGFSAGFSVSLINSKHFAVQPEMNYQFVRQNIKYNMDEYTWDTDGSLQYHRNENGEFSVNASFFQLANLFKFKMGNKVKFYLGVGPYICVPINNNLKGEVEISIYSQNTSGFDSTYTDNNINFRYMTTEGLFAATGINIPYNNSNFGLEFRAYFLPSVMNKYLLSRQNSFSLCLTYQLKSKKYDW